MCTSRIKKPLLTKDGISSTKHQFSMWKKNRKKNDGTKYKITDTQNQKAQKKKTSKKEENT
jgi:hypothetical protein